MWRMSCVRLWRPSVPCSSWRLPTRTRMWPPGERSARTSSRACEQQERLLEACLTLARSQGRPAAVRNGRPRRDRGRGAEGSRSERARERCRHPAGLGERRPGPARATRRTTSSRTRSATNRRRPGRGRNPHRVGTRRSHGRQHRSADPGRRAPASLPALPAARLRPPGSSADGVGLGLAIVQAIADAHDATVTARARTDGGLGIDVAFAALD